MPINQPNKDPEVTITTQGVNVVSEGSFVDTETQYTEFQVPTGKKWIPKYAFWDSSGFSGTVTKRQIRLRTEASTDWSYLDETTSSDTKATFLFPTELVLVAGDKIRVMMSANSGFSGTLTQKLLYVELDA